MIVSSQASVGTYVKIIPWPSSGINLHKIMYVRQCKYYILLVGKYYN